MSLEATLEPHRLPTVAKSIFRYEKLPVFARISILSTLRSNSLLMILLKFAYTFAPPSLPYATSFVNIKGFRAGPHFPVCMSAESRGPPARLKY